MNGKGGALARETKDIHAMIDITLDGTVLPIETDDPVQANAAVQRYLALRNSKAPVEDATVGAGGRLCHPTKTARAGGNARSSVGTQRAAARRLAPGARARRTIALRRSDL